jgi:hypothetical protein
MNLERAYAIAYDLAPQERRHERSRRSAINDVMELASVEGRHWKPRIMGLIKDGEPMASGGQWYQDSRPPWMVADAAAVTLATTMKQMWSTADMTPTYASDWWQGKVFQIRCFGRMTTAATPGNLTVQLGYGVADAAGALATSTGRALIASQTNIAWRFEGRVRCRGVGPGASAGILFGSGIFETDTVLIAAGGATVPGATPAQVTGLNLNQNSGIHLQLARSGSTAETAQVHDVQITAEN